MNNPTAPRRWRFLSGALSTLLGLLLLEAGLRIFWVKSWTIDAGLSNPHFHHRLKSDYTYHYYSKEFDVRIHTNHSGLRGSDPAIPKPAGTCRILMLGDSFTFGFPVQDQETFSYRIEQGLRAKGYPVEVVNAGVSGYSPVLEYLSLRDDFLRFQPDLVILWYDRADLQDDKLFEKNLLYDEQGRIVRCDPRYVNGRFDWSEWLQNHSAIAKYVNMRLVRMFDKIRILGPIGYLKVVLRGERAKVAIAKLKTQQQAEDVAAYDRFLMIRETTTPELLQKYWPTSGRYILMIRDLLAERGIPFVLGTYPYGVTVGPNQWAEGRVYWGFERGKVYPHTAARATIQRFTEEEGLPWIRTASDFRAAADKEKLFYDWDGHMTPAGHRVLAEHVLHDLKFLGLLDQRIAAMRSGGTAAAQRMEAPSGRSSHGS